MIDGQTYTLALDINAMVLLEDRFDLPFDKVMAELIDGRIKGLRTVFWAALQSHHPGTTEEDAGRLLQAAGGLAGLTSVIQKMTGETIPDARDVQELSGGAAQQKARPRKAQVGPRVNGTGEDSTSTLEPSA